MNLRDKLTNRDGTKAGRVAPNGAHRTTPWREATEDAIYTGLKEGEVWMYRAMSNQPLFYDDDGAVLKHGRDITTRLAEIGRSSIALPPGMTRPPAGFYRNMHVLTVRWYEQPSAPEDTKTEALRDYIDTELLNFTAPRQTVFIGVQLTALDSNAASRSRNFFDVFSTFFDGLFEDNPTDHDRFAIDREYVHRILANNGCRIPSTEEMRQLEGWFNYGSHTEPEIVPKPDRLIIDRRDKLEFAALERFNNARVRAPGFQWLSGVMDHEDGPSVISVRFELQPAADTRRSLRKSLQRREEIDQERQKTKQHERVEESEEYHLAAAAEAAYANADAPASLRNTSIVFGHRNEGFAHESYIDFLRNTYGIDVKPLTHRQMAALHETLPCAQVRANTFPQHLSVEMLSYAGLGMFTELGDTSGAMLGRALPDGVPYYFDIHAAARRNKPPATVIGGVPGSGKTLLGLNLAYQSALGGERVVMVNPKGDDSLYAALEFMESKGIETEWVPVSRLTESGGEGMFDPWRYARTPETAASIAANLITTAVNFSEQSQRTALRHGLLLGAKTDGVGSAMQALHMVADEFVVDQVQRMWEATPLMRLALGAEPRPRTDIDSGGVRGKVTLVEFDVDMNLPGQVQERYSDAELIGLAVFRAVTTASIGMLAGTRGGLFIIDEAHNVLAHPDTVRLIQKLMREGRSLNVAQLYISQLVTDILKAGGGGASLDAFVSRSVALQMDQEDEAIAMLKLIGYEPTQERLNMMKQFESKQLEDGTRQPSFGFVRDLDGRKSIVSFGPLGREFLAAASTNVDDRIARERASVRAAGAA